MWRMADRKGAMLEKVHVNYIVDVCAGRQSNKEVISLSKGENGRERNTIFELSTVVGAPKRRQL
jgi:hypothetical protein